MSKESEYTKVLKLEYVTTAYTCDACSKEVKANSLPEGWHEFSAHHSAWGNDSIHSHQEYHVCSPECYALQFTNVVNVYSKYDSSEVDSFNINFAEKLAVYFKNSLKR